MPEDQNFEPYIDWDGLTDEMAADFHELYAPYRAACERFIKYGKREDAVTLLRLQHDLGSINEAITRTLITVPAMVHVAGQKKTEPSDEGDNEHSIQRCTRCGSVLQFWREGLAVLTPSGPHFVQEDEVSWWPVGASIAKATDEDGPSTMYEIEGGRDLEDFEIVCVDLASQFPS